MPPLARTRVAKSIPAGRPGTQKLLQRLGKSLLLVRYRYDWTGLYRYTTVELLVDAMPVTRGHRLKDTFTVRLGKYEGTLKEAVRHHGGQWDPHLMAWTLPGKAVQILGLGHRVELMQVVERPRKKKNGPRMPGPPEPYPSVGRAPKIAGPADPQLAKPADSSHVQQQTLIDMGSPELGVENTLGRTASP